MGLSVLDLFTIGIGPSSSHTVGPMRAAKRFADELATAKLLAKTRSVQCELFGSLGATGKGHGSDRAVVLGLLGESPEGIDPDAIDDLMAGVKQSGSLSVRGSHPVGFSPEKHIVFRRRERLPLHPNGMRFLALDGAGGTLHSAEYYSVGGGFIVTAQSGSEPAAVTLPHAFRTGDELLIRCRESGLCISTLALQNEVALRRARGAEADVAAAWVVARFDAIWQAMRACVERGIATEGILPGGLKVPRRAARLRRRLQAAGTDQALDGMMPMDWVNLYALAVGEENASGGRVVTAPTNGAAGIIPAVMHYYHRFTPAAGDDGAMRFLLAAGAIGLIYKQTASLSGAEVGCQGEVGVACSMAAAGLAEVLGGTPEQVENAAEIGMEHNLGLTCDPIGGLVQVPCIERNAMGAVKAINAARLAMQGDGVHAVSLDKVIATMRQTGADMKTKYKETSRGGLALDLAVNFVEC